MIRRLRDHPRWPALIWIAGLGLGGLAGTLAGWLLVR
jgi:hypothetical protein